MTLLADQPTDCRVWTAELDDRVRHEFEFSYADDVRGRSGVLDPSDDRQSFVPHVVSISHRDAPEDNALVYENVTRTELRSPDGTIRVEAFHVGGDLNDLPGCKQAFGVNATLFERDSWLELCTVAYGSFVVTG